MTNYCCSRFEGLFGTGDNRGMSIILRRSVKFGDFFFVRFRSVSREDEERLEFTAAPVAKLIEQAIQYCPWCGCQLKEAYGQVVENLPFVDDESDYY